MRFTDLSDVQITLRKWNGVREIFLRFKNYAFVQYK